MISKDKEIVKEYKDIDKIEEIINNVEFELDEYKFMISEEKEKKEKLLKLKEAIDVKLENQVKGKEYLEKNKLEIESLIEQCVDIVKDLGKCPLCMSNLDEKHLINIRKELEEN